MTNRERQRRWRIKHKDRLKLESQQRRALRRVKTSANTKVATALRKGELVRPDVCEKCAGSGDIDAHHPDYSKPLEVEWLCRKCHYQQHRGPFEMAAKKRYRGEEHKSSKLKEHQAREALILISAGKMTKRAIARRFGVHESTIRLLELGITWKHLHTRSC